jgi:hypothetical protein
MTSECDFGQHQLSLTLSILIAVFAAFLSCDASTSAESTPGYPLVAGPGDTASLPSKVLARSWGDLRLGMTSTQFGHVCKKFGLGPLKSVEPDDFLFVTYAESPVAKHCPRGCKHLKLYTCRDQDEVYGAFLNDQAILVYESISGLLMYESISGLRPDPCGSLCKGLSNRKAADCAASAKSMACFEREMKDETQLQDSERVASFKHLHGPPQTAGKDNTTNLEWYAWHDRHTGVEFLDGGMDVEIDDLEANARLIPSEERDSAQDHEPFCDQAADLVKTIAKMRDQGIDENVALASGRATLEVLAGRKLTGAQENALSPLITRIYANPGVAPSEAQAQWLSTCYAVYPTGNP